MTPFNEDQAKSEFYWKVHAYLSENIRFADTKAGIVIAWTSTVIGLLLNAKLQDLFGKSVIGWTGLSGFICLLGAFGFAFVVVAPRLQTKQETGFIFWKSVLAHKNRQTFLEALRNESSEVLTQQVAGHLHDLATICDSKFWWFGWSLVLALVGSLLAGASYLLR